MSRRTRIHLAQALALVAIGTAGLARPGNSFAQTGSGADALLNRSAAAQGDVAAFNTIPRSPIGTGSNEVAGELALLGRMETPHTRELQLGTISQVIDEAPIDGNRALLGRWPVVHPRYTEDWAQRFANDDVGLASTGATVIATASSRFPFFALDASDAVNLVVSGNEARYGTVSEVVDGSPLVVISLGATSGEGSLTLMTSGDRLPPSGRYAIRSGEALGVGGLHFRAFFVAGSPEHPVGAFHGESGWVTITRSEAGRIAGTFELEARGFLASDLDDENRWVRVLGHFEARADSTTLANAQVTRRSWR
jgi:hypothetical protein